MAHATLTQFGGLILLFILIKGYTSARNKSPFQYEECKSGESLISNDTRWASSESGLSQWTLNADVWIPSVQNSMKFLAVDLGSEHIVTRVYTQCRQGSDEYVTEFTIEFSMDNEIWEEYTNEFGFTEIFKGEENTLVYPVIARYVKFQPFKWNQQISMTVDVIGCPYESEPVNTLGEGYIVAELNSIQTEKDLLILRFRTGQENGILLYASGENGDVLLIELRGGKLHLVIDLGSTPTISGVAHVVGGSLLDDGRWHDVILQRGGKKAKLTVDRKETEFETNGLFFRFDSDRKVYLGGKDKFKLEGLSNRYIFNGCIDFVRFNNINIIQNVKTRVSGYQLAGPVAFRCSLNTELSYSFTTTESFLRIPALHGGAVRVAFQFRTYDKGVRLLHYQMVEPSEFQVDINQNGFVYYKLTDQEYNTIQDEVKCDDPDCNSMDFADGLWHTCVVYMDSETLDVTVDRNNRVTRKSMAVTPGPVYSFGGDGLNRGFRGCLRNIEVDSSPVDLTSLNPDDVNKISIGYCDIKDKCIPNPCEHNGICSQDWATFYCDCSSTGYKGAVCHISPHPLSCTLYSMNKDADVSHDEVKIDPDGSGPIDPFTVMCRTKEAGSQYPAETWVAHNTMGLTTVDGYQEPNYYVRNIEYEADLAGLAEVIERSDSCEQELVWKCNNSRLMYLTPDFMGKTYGYWVGRTNQDMFNWGGAAPGSYKCACGLSEEGCISYSTTCNCDSGETQTQDAGLLAHKEFLPVMELHLGDTGSLTDNKIGQFKLGELKCYGDNMLDNVITFRKTDATLEFATYEGGKAVDIWFQFKTTARDGVMIHDTGDTDDNFIQIKLTGGNTIQFSYNVGHGIQVLVFKVINTISDNRWHTVHVEHNLKQAWLRVDNFPKIVYDEPLNKITRLMDLTKPLTVGAAVDHSDGFVGCMRGLRVNGVLMDLRGAVRNGQFTYGVHEGCSGKCTSSPCYNEGVCVEGYSHYTCDCSRTPFEGRVCSREVGINMRYNSMVRYDDVPLFENGGFKYIRIGFKTKKKQGILLQLKDRNYMKHISLQMNNNGGIKLALNSGGFGRWELNSALFDVDFTNGQAHEVVVRRKDSGRLIIMQIDNYPETVGYLDEPFVEELHHSVQDYKHVFIGNNDTDNTWNGFEGCIFRMQVDNLFPLKTAFQDPTPNHVTFFPEGVIHKDTCEFEEITRAPEPAEQRIYSPTCGKLAPPPVADRGGKHLDGGDLFFSFSRQDIVFDRDVGSLTLTCRVTAADISVIYYIVIRQETSPGSGEFECVTMIESGTTKTPILFDQLNTRNYSVSGTLDRSVTTYPYVSLSMNLTSVAKLNVTVNSSMDYMCEVAYKDSSTEVFEKVSTVSKIVNADCCATSKALKADTDSSQGNTSEIGITIGVIGGVLIAVAIIAAIYIYVRRKRERTLRTQANTPEMSALYSSNAPEKE